MMYDETSQTLRDMTGDQADASALVRLPLGKIMHLTCG